jgi:hypothetical protein
MLTIECIRPKMMLHASDVAGRPYHCQLNSGSRRILLGLQDLRFEVCPFALICMFVPHTLYSQRRRLRFERTWKRIIGSPSSDLSIKFVFVTNQPSLSPSPHR